MPLTYWFTKKTHKKTEERFYYVFSALPYISSSFTDKG